MKHTLVKIIKKLPILNTLYSSLRDFKSYRYYKKRGSFTQHGEGVFLQEWFKEKSDGFYIDIGASHPFRISNTYGLYELGWHGIAIDPIPEFEPMYKKLRPRDKFLNIGVGPKKGSFVYFELIPSVLSSFDADVVENLITSKKATLLRETKIDVIKPNQLFENYAQDQHIDFLSIDVEGLDLQILEAIDFSSYRPSLICVEFNTEHDKLAIIKLLNSNDYDCSNIINCNIFAVDIKAASAELNTIKN